MTEQNPYAAPSSAEPSHDPLPVDLNPKDLAKVEAVVKDAGQFWLAIILCVVCSGIGALIVPIWYLVRLLQWRYLANKHPALLSTGATPGSIQQISISTMEIYRRTCFRYDYICNGRSLHSDPRFHFARRNKVKNGVYTFGQPTPIRTWRMIMRCAKPAPARGLEVEDRSFRIGDHGR